jgi:ribosome-associated translation inhibitor RaiA
MTVPLRISWKGMEPSPALEERIRKKADWLGRFHPRILLCEVTIAAPPRHDYHGLPYDVRVEVQIAGPNVVISREPPGHGAECDPYVAVRDAFDAAARRLEEQVRRQRGHVKRHPPRAER